MTSPRVTGEDYLPAEKRFVLQAYLAEKCGFESDFTVQENEHGGYDLIDAECQTVPSMQELVLRNPWLIGPALEWLAGNQ